MMKSVPPAVAGGVIRREAPERSSPGRRSAIKDPKESMRPEGPTCFFRYLRTSVNKSEHRNPDQTVEATISRPFGPVTVILELTPPSFFADVRYRGLNSLRLRQRIARVINVHTQHGEVGRVAGEQRVVGHKHRLGAAVERDTGRIIQWHFVARLATDPSDLHAARRQDRNLVRESQRDVERAVSGEGQLIRPFAPRVHMKGFQVRGYWAVDERQAIDRASVGICRRRSNDHIHVFSFRVEPNSIRAEWDGTAAHELRTLKPDRRSAAARAIAKDRGLQRIGDVGITIVVEYDIVRNRRKVGSGRQLAGCRATARRRLIAHSSGLA